MNHRKAREMAEEERAMQAANTGAERMQRRRDRASDQIERAVKMLEAWQNRESNHCIPEYEEIDLTLCRHIDELMVLVKKLRT